MPKITCHYCNKKNHDINISGKVKGKHNKLVEYRICAKCAVSLSNINPNKDKSARLNFLSTVKKNALNDK